MTRAEKAAWKWATENKLYPYSTGRAYGEGYEQAEKDLALTWKDIAKIITIYEEGINSGEYKRYGDAKCVKKYSQDILRRFNELKAEKQ